MTTYLADAATVDAAPQIGSSGTDIASVAVTPSASIVSSGASVGATPSKLVTLGTTTASGTPAAATQVANLTTAMQAALAKQMRKNPGVLTDAQSQLLTAKFVAFAAASKTKDSVSSAAAWNDFMASATAIKSARRAAQPSGGADLALDDNGSFGYDYPLAPVGGLLGAIIGTPFALLGTALSIGAAVVDTAATAAVDVVDVGADVVGSAADLVLDTTGNVLTVADSFAADLFSFIL